MESTSELLDDMIIQIGGMGRFQIILIIIVLGSKLPVTWSMLMMTFGGANLDWWCETENSTSTQHVFYNQTTRLKACSLPDTTEQCDSYSFADDMSTVVNEWDLVCDRDWIVSTITTIQMGGLLASGFIAGQLADLIGRKPTYLMSFLFLTIFNTAAAFSVSWQMFAVFRFLIGIACGCYLTVFFTFMTEFATSKWRPMIMAIPMWPIWAAMYALLSWLLHDWKYIQIATAVASAPWLLAWWFVPESFRWLVSHNKIDEAEKVIYKIATINNRPLPNTSHLRIAAEIEFQQIREKSRQYTIIDIFCNLKAAKHTFLNSIIWLSCGYGYYAIAFGVQQLSGSLYLNMFLLSIVEAPAQFITWFFNHFVGRRWTCVGFFLIAGVAGFIVAALEITDVSLKSQLINGFALTAKLGVAAAWAANMVLASELYPTVIRNIAYGVNNSASRIGAMIAPQIVFISQNVPGLMYFVFGGVMMLSALCSALFPETKNRVMSDLIENGDRNKSSNSIAVKIEKGEIKFEDSNKNSRL